MARWRPNPVFIFECVAAARRWQTYAVRTAFVGVLFVSLLCVWWARVPNDSRGLTRNELASIGESFFLAFIATQLALVLLAAPAYTAGAVCMDRARGTLAHMLMTDLSAAEIVLGKLGARLLPILGLVLVGLPILALTMLIGGIDPHAVAGSFMITIGVAVAGCTLALALSVWGNQPHEALLATWFVWAIVLLPLPVWGFSASPWTLNTSPPPAWLKKINPFWLTFAPYTEPDRIVLADCLAFLGGALGLSALFTLFAVLTLRRAALSAPRSVARRWLPFDIGPPLDFNPVLWREWHRRRPSRWMRIVWSVYFVLSVAASAFVLATDRWSGWMFSGLVNACVFTIGLLLVSVTSVTSLFEERVRGSLDVLLTTPLSSASIVWGKWGGSFRTVMLVSLLPAALASCMLFKSKVLDASRLGGFCMLIPLLFAYGGLVNSIGLAIAVRVRRFGVAIGLSVAVYLLLAIGTLFLLIATNSGRDSEGLLYISPLFGVAAATYQVAGASFDHTGLMYLWLILDGVAAVTLAAATQSIFDRCLGRIEGWAAPEKPPPRRKVE